MTMELNYGILSTSSIAPRFIAGVREAKAGNIVAVSSRSLQKAQEKAELWKIPKAYGSHEALLNDPDVNIVYISTINAQHYIWAKAAIEQGKHVICEKPCTVTEKQTRELFELAQRKGVFLMEAQKMLFLPAIAQVRRRIEAGDLGKIRMAQITNSFAPGYNTWQFDKEAGGGTLLSAGIYGVQLMLWLFGDITDISGVKSARPGEGENQFSLSGVCGEDVVFTVQNSTCVTLDNTAKIYGEKGWVEIPEFWKARKAVFYIEGKEPEIVEYPCEYELAYEAEHIQHCIQNGLRTSPVVTKELSVAGITAIDRVRENWK